MSEAKIYLPCGHPIGCLYSYRIGKETVRYCFGCLCEKSGLKPITDEDRTKCTNVSKLVPTIKTSQSESKVIPIKESIKLTK